MIRGLTRSYEAIASIAAYRIVAFGDAANNNKIVTASAATQPLAGTTGQLGGPAGAMVDVAKEAIPQVQLGGPVGAGDPLTSNAVGKAIKATVAGQRIIGFAEQPGVADDIIDYISAPGVLGGV
ncbi:hypothetical protein [Sphingomonas panni]|uniref:hypothetical protein n=1 Tax=Sphingomonas panni TaxID=237612 RepID=UPI001F5BA148|nr:hypothetical protein [Sphingomonas panni]